MPSQQGEAEGRPGNDAESAERHAEVSLANRLQDRITLGVNQTNKHSLSSRGRCLTTDVCVVFGENAFGQLWGYRRSKLFLMQISAGNLL